MVVDDSKPNPSAVRSQLREWEDYNLAMRLQDQEFNQHYDQNRSERRTVGSDTKHSRVVQQTEDEVARAMRRQVHRQIEETDEQLAQRLAAEWKAEEGRKADEKLRQELIDEEIARRLAETGEYSADLPGSSAFPSSSTLPTQPPSYDFAVRQPQGQQEDSLIDFSSPTAQNPSSSYTLLSNQSVTTPTRRGIALPGLATTVPSPSSSNLPPPVSTSHQLVSQPSLDSPIAWPPPPPSVLNSNVQLAPNNPFLTDLMSSTNASVAPPSVMPPPSIGFSQQPMTSYLQSQPPSIGFQSEFGLPPPSSLALGLSGPSQSYSSQ